LFIINGIQSSAVYIEEDVEGHWPSFEGFLLLL